MQKFYFLNLERHAVLSNVISNIQIWKNIAFEISKHGTVKATACR